MDHSEDSKNARHGPGNASGLDGATSRVIEELFPGMFRGNSIERERAEQLTLTMLHDMYGIGDFVFHTIDVEPTDEEKGLGGEWDDGLKMARDMGWSNLDYLVEAARGGCEKAVKDGVLPQTLLILTPTSVTLTEIHDQPDPEIANYPALLDLHMALFDLAVVKHLKELKALAYARAFETVSTEFLDAGRKAVAKVGHLRDMAPEDIQRTATIFASDRNGKTRSVHGYIETNDQGERYTSDWVEPEISESSTEFFAIKSW